MKLVCNLCEVKIQYFLLIRDSFMKKKYTIICLSALIIFVSLWEYYSCRNIAFNLVCPAPSGIFKALSRALPLLTKEALTTFRGMTGGFLGAVALSLGCAIFMNRFKESKSFFHPIFVLIQCIPLFTLAPLIVLWFGWGLQAVVIPNVLMIFFPLTLAISQGLETVPEAFEEFFKTHQATYKQTLIKLRLPFALPHIFSGLKIAAVSAGFGTIAGEWVVGDSGLGILILESRRHYDMELTFATLIVLATLAISFYLLVLCLERSCLVAFRIYNQKTARSLKIRKLQPKLVGGMLLAFFAIPIAFFNIFSPSDPIRNISLQKTTLLLDWIPCINHVPLYVGVENGIFEKYGIDLKIKKSYDGGSGVPHLIFEKVDLILQSTLSTIKASLKNNPVQIVGNLISSPLSGLICRNDCEPILKPSDLTGRVLGISLITPDTSIFIDNLKEHDISPSDIKNVSTDLIAPMLLNKIDFLYGGFWNIEGVQLESLGLNVRIFLPSSYGAPDTPQLLVVAKKNTVFASENFVLSFRQALNESIYFCKEHPQKSLNIFLNKCPENKNLREQTIRQWEKTLPLLASNQNPLGEAVINNSLKWIVSRGFNKQSEVLYFKASNLEPF